MLLSLDSSVALSRNKHQYEPSEDQPFSVIATKAAVLLEQVSSRAVPTRDETGPHSRTPNCPEELLRENKGDLCKDAEMSRREVTLDFREDTSWPENREKLQIFIFSAFVWLLHPYLYSTSTQLLLIGVP